MNQRELDDRFMKERHVQPVLDGRGQGPEGPDAVEVGRKRRGGGRLVLERAARHRGDLRAIRR